MPLGEQDPDVVRKQIAGSPVKSISDDHAQVWEADDARMVVTVPVHMAMRQVVRIIVVRVDVNAIRPIIEDFGHPLLPFAHQSV